MLLAEFDREMANTRKLLELVPDDKFEYRPHPKSMALGPPASHIVALRFWTRVALETGKKHIEYTNRAARCIR